MLRSAVRFARGLRFLPVVALLATGCIDEWFSTPAAPPKPAPAARAADLWDLAPQDAVSGIVIHDGAIARALALMADPHPSPARDAFEDLAKERTKLPFDPLSPAAWGGAGLDPQKGAAAFGFADKKRGALLVLPVVDRDLFRRAFGFYTRLEAGQEVDVLDDRTFCAATGGHYLCARSFDTIASAAAPHASPLADAAHAVAEHGELEVYVTRDDPGIARLNHEPESVGWIREVTGALRLRDDGATLHLVATGSLATPAARGLYALFPPDDLVAAAKGATTLGRIHIDPAAFFASRKDLEPEVRTELVEQLTGDVQILPTGPGFAGARMVLPLHDAARVEAFVKKRCALEAAKSDVRPLGAFKVEAHGCSAAFDAHKLTIPVGFPVVPVAMAAEGGKLVVSVGNASSATRARSERPAAEGDAAKHALETPQTLLFLGHDLGIGPEVGAGAFFRDAIPLFGARVGAAVEGWDYATAHLSEVLVRARVTDEGGDFTIDLTSFADDPAPARAAYDDALARRFAGDDAGYRSALASIEQRFPGTRAARRAAEVREGAPYFGAGVALLGTLSLMGRSGEKKR